LFFACDGDRAAIELDSGSSSRKGVEVQVLSSAPKSRVRR
jgi:hypothetical protein